MKRIILSLGFVLTMLFAYSQGLQNIIVEQYYVADANDAAGSAGILPEGSKTYRIYVDMQPGYKFQAVYGTPSPTHTMFIKTTTGFFNNEDRGATTPAYTKTQAKGNTVMLDSWLSVGAGCAANFGVMKTDDNGVGTVVNSDGILQNTDVWAGIPIKTQDGLITGTVGTVTSVGQVIDSIAVFDATSYAGKQFVITDGAWSNLSGSTGQDPATNKVLIAQITTDGDLSFELNIQIGTPTGGTEKYVARDPQGSEIKFAGCTYPEPQIPGCMNPIACNYNPDATQDNGSCLVPVANCWECNQDSTALIIVDADQDGTCNAQDGCPNDPNKIAPGICGCGVSDDDTNGNGIPDCNDVPGCTNPIACNYNPAANLNDGSCLIPVPNCWECGPGGLSLVMIDTDNDGVCDANEVLGCTSQTACNYDANATEDDGSCVEPKANCIVCNGQGGWTIIDSDNDGICDEEDPFPFTLAYGIENTKKSCIQPDPFCVPFLATDTVTDIIGFDVVLHYDATLVTPVAGDGSTNVVISNDLIDVPSYASAYVNIDAANSRIFISISLNGSGPIGENFDGIGEVFCFKFNRTANFDYVDTAFFTVSQVVESYFDDIVNLDASNITPGHFSTYKDSVLYGNLKFWNYSNPIAYDEANPNDYLVTNIYGIDSLCTETSKSTVIERPDINGLFEYSIWNGKAIEIDKNIHDTTEMMGTVNGGDSWIIKRVLVNDISYIPNVYQIIALDVNTDGFVSSGDLSQIKQRAVDLIPEFKQSWNYNSQGIKIVNEPSKDWLFIDKTTIESDSSFVISSSYPSNDGKGYSKWRVPQIPHCLPVMIQDYDDCPVITPETYQGIMVGDADYSWMTIGLGTGLKGGNEVVFNMENAHISNGYIEIPVSINSDEVVNSMDFNMIYNTNKLTFETITGYTENIDITVNATGGKLKMTSYSLEKYNTKGNAVVSIKFSSSDELVATDFSNINAYVNGKPSIIQVIPLSITNATANDKVNVYPNPNSGRFVVEISNANSKDVTISLVDVTGKVIFTEKYDQVSVMKRNIDVTNYSKGVYFMKVQSNDNVSISKVVIQ